MKNFGIYVHIPFCEKKCKYCDFISFDNCNAEKKEEYVECLLNEIDNWYFNGMVSSMPLKSINKTDVSTIYIGGGTPSSISSDLIEKILNKIYEKFNVDENTEITIEINPGTVNEEKLQMYKKIGINRLSIGLQSANDELLKMLGRIHNFDEFENVFECSRNVGFNNINVDLMLGLPTQTLSDMENSLKKVIELKPEHISLYSLILEEGTELEKLINENKLQMLSEDMERNMYWKTKEILEKNGYSHYEISNFAKKSFESKHNLSCWNQEEYIGFGLAAHSYIEGKRFSNTDDLEQYIKNIKEKNFDKNVILHEKQNFENMAKEYMMLGFRKIDGVKISEFEQKFQINPLFYFRFEISKLQDEDLIEVDLDNIRLTKNGLDFANKVFEEFV